MFALMKLNSNFKCMSLRNPKYSVFYNPFSTKPLISTQKIFNFDWYLELIFLFSTVYYKHRKSDYKEDEVKYIELQHSLLTESRL